MYLGMIRSTVRGDGPEAANPGPGRWSGVCLRVAAGMGLGSLLLLAGLAGAPASASDTTVVSLPPADAPFTRPPRAVEVPEILSVADAALYREIFALQEAGRWAEADRQIARLHDRVLMGHVQAQRYLHPTAYRSRYAELRDWLGTHADHPDAQRIHALALQRKPANVPAPERPRDRFTVSSNNVDPAAAANGPARRVGINAAERHAVAHVAANVRREYLTVSERYLDQPEIARAVGPAGIDRARALIAAGWFRRGDTDKAYALARRAADRSGAEAPQALWWAGLAAFRLGFLDDARRYLEALSQADTATPAEQAAGAFWAGRAALKGGDMARVGALMASAARHDRTFYGQLAARIRGHEPGYEWGASDVVARDLAAFSAKPAGRRVLALLQIGEGERAEAELRAVRLGLSPAVLRTVALLSDAADMPGAALRAGRVLLTGTGERLDAALYPLPHWMPNGGYRIDRALVYALTRQESAFNVRARSRAGARGLMQLMPATARYMSEDRRSFRGANGTELFDPQLNLELGQRYVSYLLGGEVVSGNLILAIAAYNGGPGNLARWQREILHDSDPLLFIEMIPLAETRGFVKSVLQNLWAYRSRLGQENPSLDALAGGRWPVYVSLDGATFGVAEERP